MFNSTTPLALPHYYVVFFSSGFRTTEHTDSPALLKRILTYQNPPIPRPLCRGAAASQQLDPYPLELL